MFCHEGPWSLVKSRVWFIDPDGTNLREGRKRQRPPGDMAELWGHEYWLADSSRAAYVYFPEKYGRDATVRLLDPDTLTEDVLMPVSRYSHFISNRDNSLIVGDGHVPADENIYVVDTQRRTERLLCRHASSNKPYLHPRTGKPNTQEVHPHPCFSPDSRQVVFSSDRDGGPAVYVVDVPAG
jgi:oligogalacturonide lyase